jgi:hypothetical protein
MFPAGHPAGGHIFQKFIYTGREEREYLFENGKASPDDGSGYG